MSVEYEGLVRDLTVPLVPAEVGNVLLRAVAERYERVPGLLADAIHAVRGDLPL